MNANQQTSTGQPGWQRSVVRHRCVPFLHPARWNNDPGDGPVLYHSFPPLNGFRRAGVDVGFWAVLAHVF